MRKQRKKLNNRSLITAAFTAAFMMIIFGAAHRALTALLLNSEGLSSLSPDALETFPLQIKEWTGREEPLDEAVIEATDTEAYINRRYFRYNSSEQVCLYIAAGKRERDLMTHRPGVCYPDAGWTSINSSETDLSLDDGNSLPCSIFQFTKGPLNPRKIVILDYYIVDDQSCRDISQQRRKSWRGSGFVDYFIQVQILGEVPADQSEPTEKMVCDFACESYPFIFQVLEDIEKSNTPNAGDPNINDNIESVNNN